MLMDYQKDKPEQPNVYYQLGNLSYSLLPKYDALHSYAEYRSLLYNSKLFYGNCLYFAKGHNLPGWQYEEIAQGSKKIDYAQLNAYLSPRLKEVKRLQTACDSVHNSFYRLVEQYNSCQQRFNRFLELYTREKTAHLQLTPDQRKDLERLARDAKPLPKLIETYLSALALEPLEGYHPTFRWQAIELYRLDGLTKTDFLQNDIALWDYATWVTHFLDEQTNQYERLYSDVENEHSRLTKDLQRYRTGAPVSGQCDATITGRCERLELNTPVTQAIQYQQAMVQLGALEQQIKAVKTPSAIAEISPVLQLAQDAQIFHQQLQQTPYQTMGDSAMQLIRTQLITWAKPLASSQSPTYTSPISGEVTRYKASGGQQVYGLHPFANGWRCVLVNTSSKEAQVVELNESLAIRKVILRAPGEKPFIFIALPNSRWSLVTDKNIWFGE